MDEERQEMNNGFEKYGYYILETLKEMNGDIRSLERKIEDFRKEMFAWRAEVEKEVYIQKGKIAVIILFVSTLISVIVTAIDNVVKLIWG